MGRLVGGGGAGGARAGAAGGCGGRQPHLLPPCRGTRKTISSKWKKGGWRVPFPGEGREQARCRRGAVPRLLAALPGLGKASRVPVQRLPSKAAGDSGSYQSIFRCEYPRSGYFKGAAVTRVVTPPVNSVLFPTRMQHLEMQLPVLGFPSPGGSPSIGGVPPMALPARGQDGLGKLPCRVPVPRLEKQSHPCCQAIQWEGDRRGGWCCCVQH